MPSGCRFAAVSRRWTKALTGPDWSKRKGKGRRSPFHPSLGLPALVRTWALGLSVNLYRRMTRGLCLGLLTWVLSQAVNELPRKS